MLRGDLDCVLRECFRTRVFPRVGRITRTALFAGLVLLTAKVGCTSAGSAGRTRKPAQASRVAPEAVRAPAVPPVSPPPPVAPPPPRVVAAAAAVEPRVEAPAAALEAAKEDTRARIPDLGLPPVAKVLIVGDSMAATDFGRALEKKLQAHERLKAVRRGKSSTGLARPDFFDWMGEAKKQIARHKPDLVIVIIGGNDGQDLIPKKGRGRVHWNKSKWADAYTARVQNFAKLLMGERRHVVWLELPAMDRKKFERKLSYIRDVQKRALASLGPRVRYLETREIFYDDKGRLVRKIPKGKKKVALRQKDGIHFSLPGSRYFADQVYPDVVQTWALTP